MISLQQLIHNIHPLPVADLNRLLDSGEEVFIPKKTIVIHQDEINSSLYLIKSGIMRGFRSDVDRETTFWFVPPGEVAYSSWGFVERRPSLINIMASSDTVAYHYTKEKFETVLNSSEQLAVWGRKLFERMLFTNDQWLLFFSKPLAADRYRALIEKMPDFLQEVPLKEIASYLGVTPQSLSRIRGEWVKKK